MNVVLWFLRLFNGQVELTILHDCVTRVTVLVDRILKVSDYA